MKTGLSISLFAWCIPLFFFASNPANASLRALAAACVPADLKQIAIAQVLRQVAKESGFDFKNLKPLLGLRSEVLEQVKERYEYRKGRGEQLGLPVLAEISNMTLAERALIFSVFYGELQRLGLVTFRDAWLLRISPNGHLPKDQGPTSGKVQIVENPHDPEAQWRIRELVEFSSNDYLRLSRHPHVIARKNEVPATSSTGSPLLTGTSTLHIALERKLSEFFGGEDALIYSSGYNANTGWVRALTYEGDLVLYDFKSHASLEDGLRVARARKVVTQVFPHNDVAKVEAKLKRFRRDPKNEHKNIFISVEGIYSMDGDMAPVDKLLDLAKKYNAVIVPDEAHSIGVMGSHGRGVVDHFELLKDPTNLDHILIMGTLSKALGSGGGFLTGKREYVDLIRFYSNPYIFSSAITPPDVAAALGALEVMEHSDARVQRLRYNIDYIKTGLHAMGIPVNLENPGAIIPVLAPKGINVRELNRFLHNNGISISAPERPAVREDILRIALNSELTEPEMDMFLDKMRQISGQLIEAPK